MQKNKTSHYNYNVYVGPAPATGLNFLDVSGNISTGPVVYWPDAGVGYLQQSLINLSTGAKIDNKDNVYALIATGFSGFHGSYQVFPIPSGNSGIFRAEMEVYIPSSNPQVKSLYFSKNAGAGSFAILYTGLDTWQKIVAQGLYGNSTNTSNDFIGPTLVSGNAVTSNSNSFNLTGTNIVYIKNYRITQLSGNYHHNLLRELNRVQSFDYSFDIGRQDLQNVGEIGISEAKSINYPSAQFNISTLMCGAENDHLIGLDVNFPCFFSGFNGQPFKDINYDLVTGFNTKLLYSRLNTGIFFPFRYTDKKNFYISITDSEGAENNGNIHSLTGTSIAFGNCYLDSYQVSASVGANPTINYGFSAENVEVNSEMIGISPGLNPKDLSKVNSGYYIIPYSTGDSFPSVLNPGDMVISVSNTGYGGETAIKDIGYAKNDWKIQSFVFDINFERDPLTSVGWQLPIYRSIKYPIFANIGLDLVVGDNQAQELKTIFNNNYPYNIEVGFNHPCQFTGANSYKNRMLQYTFNSAELTNLSSSMTVNDFQKVSLGFRQEINPFKGIGVNISGIVFGRTLIETGSNNNSCFRSAKFVHISGTRTFVDSVI